MPLAFSELFDPRHIALDLRATTQNEAVLEIVELLRATGGIDEYYKFADEVMQREGRSSTNTGEGVAFPHARTDLVDRLVLGIGRSAAGVRFGDSPQLVHLIFLVGVPQRLVTDYLVCVGTIVRIVKPEERRNALMAAESVEEFASIMRAGALLLE